VIVLASAFANVRRFTLCLVSLDGIKLTAGPTASFDRLRELRLEKVDRFALRLIVNCSMPVLETLGIDCIAFTQTYTAGEALGQWDTGKPPLPLKILPSVRNVIVYNLEYWSDIVQFLLMLPNVLHLAISSFLELGSSRNLSVVGGLLCPKMESLVVQRSGEDVLRDAAMDRTGSLKRVVLGCPPVSEDVPEWLRAPVSLDGIETKVVPVNALRFDRVWDHIVYHMPLE